MSIRVIGGAQRHGESSCHHVPIWEECYLEVHPDDRRQLTMKIELIAPSLRDPRAIGSKDFRIPQMALALLAGLTPADIDVSITDELLQPIDFDKEANLVGVTVNTKTVVRAYEIADEFRSRSVPVVLGGIHPTAVPDEAIQHADAVVIGEAEGLWTRVLQDCKNGRLSKFYHSNEFPSLENSPLPRRELFQKDKYFTVNTVQTSRGCPYACHFCSVSILYGKGVRLRPVDDVIAEIKTLKGRKLFFVDDNIVGRPEYAKQLFTRLIPLKKMWIGQASVTVANNPEILKLLHKSGCQGLFVGFETTSVDSLKEVGKSQNINNDYIDTIKKLHDNGMLVMGSFIVGFDGDDKSCFEKQLDFAIRSKINIANFCLLMPYPGTILYERMKEEKRLIDDKWWLKYRANDVVFRPKLMTRDELYQGWVWTIKEFSKLRPTLKRCTQGIGKRSLLWNIFNWKINMGYRGGAYVPLDKTNP
jgi:radical SAM superfamily enzyme YgiQ (UPF0313 family)